MAIALFMWGAIQCFIVGCVLPLVKKSFNNLLLSSIFIITALNIFAQYLLRYLDFKYNLPEFLIIPDILDLFLPAMVFFYINRILGSPYKVKPYMPFLLPTLWSLVLIIYVFSTPDFSFELYIGSVFHIISLAVIFCWKAFLFIKSYSLMDFEKNLIQIKNNMLLQWPKALTAFIGILAYIAFVNFAYWVMVRLTIENRSVIGVLQQIVEVNYVFFTCSIIFVTIFFTFKYPKILNGTAIVKLPKQEILPEREEHLKLLTDLIENKQVHLDTELNEKKLAEIMDIPSYLLSKLLNETVGKSFSEYINEKRIEEAKRLLTDEAADDMTVYAIAIDSGFRSESVFYVNFKKHTGHTPIQYKKKHQKAQAAS